MRDRERDFGSTGSRELRVETIPRETQIVLKNYWLNKGHLMRSRALFRVRFQIGVRFKFERRFCSNFDIFICQFSQSQS